jgi:multidrug efflux pump subunit AcrA (membrane-fusion protein)
MTPRDALLAGMIVASIGCRSPVGAPSAATAAPPAPTRAHLVTALGRLEPRDGILRVAGPPRPTVVIADLLVDQGDRVSAGQPLAVLQTRPENEARVARARAELSNATVDLGRVGDLFRQAIASAASHDAARLRVEVARAELQAAEATLALDTVCAPVAGQVLAVHARAGERVDDDGIIELARNDEMYAVAEVYETDVVRVRIGQRASVRSPVLGSPLTGHVDRIGLRIGRQTMLDTDPVKQADARVVEVRVRLDDSERAAALSQLRVEVAIEP